MNDAPTLIVHATYILDAGDVDTFRELAARMASTGSGWDGCLFLVAAQDVADRTTFHTFEGWRDQAALDSFASSDRFKGMMREVGALKVASRAVVGYTVSDGKPLDLPS